MAFANAASEDIYDHYYAEEALARGTGVTTSSDKSGSLLFSSLNPMLGLPLHLWNRYQSMLIKKWRISQSKLSVNGRSS